MLMCRDCGRCFDDDDPIFVINRETGNYSACPRCGSPDIDDAVYCAECEMPFFKDDITDCGWLCKNCAAETKRTFDDLMIDNFTDAQISFLDSICDHLFGG